MRVPVWLIIFLFFTGEISAQNNSSLTSALEQVNPNRIQANMTFLADDLLEGRQPGTRGFDIASKYVESEFISIGLQPAGENNSYIQQVPLLHGTVNKQQSSLSMNMNGQTLYFVYGTHYIFDPYFSSDTSMVSAPVIFAGFGVSAPELGYDDYKEIDARGKIIAMIYDAPEIFQNNERAYFSSEATKLQAAIDHGAVGVVFLSTDGQSTEEWDAMIRRTAQGGYKWLDKNSKPHDAYEQIKVNATLNVAETKRIFDLVKRDPEEILNNLHKGKSQSFYLPITASCTVYTNRQVIQSSNLVGIIPGSDSSLKNEYVSYAAHIDHFGIGVAVNGDSIYNGAHDNTSGVAILLEIARTFKALPVKPKRSILFTVVTAEEFGLLGSDYFINNPTVSGAIVANLALDMPFFFHPVLDIVPYGAQHSSLNNQVNESIKILALKISPDPFPKQVIFIRSDHFSFIKKGIPSLFIKSGFLTNPEDTVDRPKTDVGWRSITYHTPKDDMSQPFIFSAAATHVKNNFLIGYFTANDTSRPRWNKNDFFGNKFGTPETKAQ